MKDLYSLKKQNKLKEIIEIYEENINNNYSLFELNTILESYYKLKYFENGESLSNIILEKYPDNKFTLKWKGYICYEKKDFENAKYFLEKIIYTNSKPFVKDIYILYEVYNKIKEKEKAQRLLNEYKDIFFGSNYYKSWYYKEIIKLENKAPDISINEDNDYIKFLEIKNKINSLGTIEKINEIENLRLIKKYSNNKYLIQHLASLYIKNNNFKKAEKLYLELDKNSNSKDIFNKKSLGYLYIKWDKNDEGVEILLALIENYFKEKPFQKILGSGIVKSSKKDEYLRRIQNKIDISPNVKKYYYPFMAEIKKYENLL